MTFGNSRLLIFTALLGLAPAASLNAAVTPAALSVSGILKDAGGDALLQPNVTFRLQIFDAAETCLLYSEVHAGEDLSHTDGHFSLLLGQGTSVVNNVGAAGKLDAKVFANPGAVPVANCGGNATVALNPGDARAIRISYDLGGGYVALTPSIPLVSVAYALVAETLNGLHSSDFIQANGTGALNQTNAEYAFSQTNWPRLKALLDGTSGQYLPTSPSAPLDLNNQRVTNVRDPAAAQDAATKHYVDTNLGGNALDLTGVGPMTGAGSTLVWDATANKWVAGTVSSAPTGAAGGALSGTYPNPGLADDVVTAAKINTTGGGINRLLITDATTGARVGFGTCALGQVYVWTATGFTCASGASLAPVQSVAGRTGAVVLNAADINGLGTAALYDHGTAANQIPRLDASARLPAVDGSLVTNVNAVQLQTRPVAAVVPTPGQVLGWNGTAWTPVSVAASGTVTNVATGAGLLGGPVTTSGTLSVDVGVTANKILQLNGTAQIPAVDGSLLTQVNAVRLQTRAIASTAPTAGQVLGWNATSSQWEPVSAASGSVTSVATANGLLGGPITAAGTLSVDTGTTANKILQLNGTAQVPAVDGSLLTQVNAVRLQTRAIASTAPTAGQVLGWNATSSQWEPTTGAAGSVTNVATGTGLTGGPITNSGTISVDVGITANKILQLNGSAQVPAVDGSLLTQVNAVRLQTRAVAATAPTAGQVLGWNATSSQWEPTTGAAGSVTSVTGGVGLLGGSITDSGTLNVDVGVTANKILQLNGTAQIPAVDGSLLTQINAVRLQTRTIASTAPTAGQVLGWNATASQWEPTTGAAGSVTNVATGTGLTGGPITTSGTLNVDVGVTANKILQLNGTAQIPAVDGSLLTQVNAVRLQTRTIAATAPTAGQVLGWNATASQWEPVSAASGSVTSVATGTGLLGGAITTTGTLSVDVGTAANKVVQENANAQIAQASGTLAAPSYSFGASASTGLYSPGANQVAVVANGTAAVSVLANGNVGIGNVTPAARLDVAGTGDASAIIVPRDGTRPTTAVNGMIRYNTGSNALEAYANNSWQTLAGAGVGAYLPLAGGTMSGAINMGGQTIQGTSAASGTLTLDSTSNATKGNIILNPSGGNVGIGATNPQAPLTVAKLSSGAEVIGIHLTNPAGNPMVNGTGVAIDLDPMGTMGSRSAQIAGVSAGTSNNQADLVFRVSNAAAPAEAVRVRFNGNVGIGTPNPAAKLHVAGPDVVFNLNPGSGSPSEGYFRFTSDTSANWIQSAPASPTSAAFKDLYISGWYGGGFIPLTVKASGFVGVGTTTPASNLHVISSNGPTSGMARFTTGDYVDGSIGSGLFIGTGATSGNTYSYLAAGSAGFSANANLILQRNGGNVGIGTTTPQAILDVQTTGTTSAIIIPRDTTGNRPAGVNGMLRYNTSNSKFEAFENNAWVNVIGGGSGGVTFPLQGPQGSQTNPTYSFTNSTNTGMYNPNAGQLALAANGNNAVTIDTNGFVGLMTNAPGVSLDVAGQALRVRGTTSTAGEVRLSPGPTVGSNYVGFRGPTTNPTTNVLWQLPAADGTNGQVLTTNGSGVLTFTTPSGGGGGSITCGDFSTNQAKLITSTGGNWAPYCLIGGANSFQNSNWTGRTASTYNNAITSCAADGADLCSMSDLKKAYGSTGGNTGLSGLQLWTSNMGYVQQMQNGTTCQGGGTCYPQEWQPYVFQNGNFSNGHVDLSQQQWQFFCCRH